MNGAIVRCRCGHQVLSKEVLRTDLYERRSSEGSAEYVCVRYRCRRCRRLGESFVAETLWDWSALEGDNSELSETERDRFRDAEPISENEMLAFHEELENLSLLSDLKVEGSATNTSEISQQAATPEVKNDSPSDTPLLPDASIQAGAEPPRDATREPRSAAPKPPEKPAPNAARGDAPRGDNP